MLSLFFFVLGFISYVIFPETHTSLLKGPAHCDSFSFSFLFLDITGKGIMHPEVDGNEDLVLVQFATLNMLDDHQNYLA